jgi:hypothetical protein
MHAAAALGRHRLVRGVRYNSRRYDRGRECTGAHSWPDGILPGSCGDGNSRSQIEKIAAGAACSAQLTRAGKSGCRAMAPLVRSGAGDCAAAHSKQRGAGIFRGLRLLSGRCCRTGAGNQRCVPGTNTRVTKRLRAAGQRKSDRHRQDTNRSQGMLLAAHTFTGRHRARRWA